MTRRREQQTCYFLLQRELERREMSSRDAAQFLKINVRNVRKYFALLYGNELCHIARWAHSGAGPYFPVYGPGSGIDAKHPDVKQNSRERRRARRITSSRFGPRVRGTLGIYR